MAKRMTFSPVLKPFWKTWEMVFSPRSSLSMCMTALPEGQRLYKANWQSPKRSYHIWRYIPADPDATIKVVAKDAMGNVVAEFEAHAR